MSRNDNTEAVAKIQNVIDRLESGEGPGHASAAAAELREVKAMLQADDELPTPAVSADEQNVIDAERGDAPTD